MTYCKTYARMQWRNDLSCFIIFMHMPCVLCSAYAMYFAFCLCGVFCYLACVYLVGMCLCTGNGILDLRRLTGTHQDQESGS